MAQLLDYAEGLQKVIRKPDRLEKYIKSYKAKEIPKDKQFTEKQEIKYYHVIWKYYMKQVIIKMEWPHLVKIIQENLYLGDYTKETEAFAKYYKSKEYEYENLITYFIFRYFLKAVFDNDVLTKVKMGIVSVLLIRQCDIGTWINKERVLNFKEQVDICHLYSREVEHSEENFAALCKLFKTKKEFKNKNLVKLIK